MNFRVPAVLLMSVLALAGCYDSGAELYAKREKFLDKVTGDGVTYRTQLQQQGSPLSEQSCLIGYQLRDYQNPEIPVAPDDDKAWRQQIQEAYIKGCLRACP